MKASIAEALQVLKDHWGYSSFRPAQEQVIQHLLDGDDVLAVLATSYGKSVTFQVPALLRDGVCLVVSPLIALMKDQVDGANQRGIPAAFVNSHLDADEISDRYAELRSGAFKLFYITPERVRSPAFRDALAGTTVNLIAVDEAHCASLWGHDFRPDYQRLSELGDLLFAAHNDRPPILAATATATSDIEADIATSLGMSEEFVRVVGDPIRPNITYHREDYGSEWGALRNAIDKYCVGSPGRHIVYCGTRKATETVADILEERTGCRALSYHGGLAKDRRTNVQDAFVAGDIRFIAATNAFGMGIDVPDIRAVIHFGVPGSIEAYVQETGRAGRDGQPAAVTLIDSEFAVTLQRRFIDQANPPVGCYELVWDWLNKEIEPGGSIQLSTAAMADRIPTKSKDGKLDGAQVATVLNILQAHGLVERIFFTRGTDLTVHLDKATSRTFAGTRLRIVQTLMEDALGRVKDANSGAKDVPVTVEKTDLAAQAGCTVSTITTHFRALQEDGIITLGETFRGKTTKLRKPGVDLWAHLDQEGIARKRKHDLDRFAKMLDYQKASDPKQFIRDYFECNAVVSGRRAPVNEDDWL